MYLGGRGSPIWVSSRTKSEKDMYTQTYKESDLDINIPAGLSKVGHRFGALQAPLSQQVAR